MKLTAQNICVEAGNTQIVSDASFNLHPGECVALVGPNGAGKSTLLRALLHLHAAQSGSVLLDDVDSKEISLRVRSRLLSYLQQERRIEWSLSCREIVWLGRHPYQGRLGQASADCAAIVEAALQAVDAANIAARNGAVLSGGEKARVLLARALAVQAPIMLADEPIAALDPWHQLQVMTLLQNYANEGRAVLAVMHDLSMVARFFTRVIVMHEGKIIVDGAPKKVLDASLLKNVYQVSAIEGVHEGEPWLLPWQQA